MDKLTIASHMTRSPYTIGNDQPIAAAHRLMREHGIRHLPVLSGARLVGIVTDRDLALVETMPGIDPAVVKVEEAMTPDPYTIASHCSLEWVALQMAEHKYGSTVVVDDGKVVGVFTTVDALRALTELLERARRRRRRATYPKVMS
jgi:acetoin utilization protein AcuB